MNPTSSANAFWRWRAPYLHHAKMNWNTCWYCYGCVVPKKFCTRAQTHTQQNNGMRVYILGVVCSSIFIQVPFWTDSGEEAVDHGLSVLCCHQNLWKPSLPHAMPILFQGTMVVYNPLYAVGIGEVSQSRYHARNTEFLILRWPGFPKHHWLFTLASWDMDTPNSCCIKQLFNCHLITFMPELP